MQENKFTENKEWQLAEKNRSVWARIVRSERVEYNRSENNLKYVVCPFKAIAGDRPLLYSDIELRWINSFIRIK